MTRVLSELLGTREPQFQQGLKQLEIMAGHPQADILELFQTLLELRFPGAQ